MKKQLSVFIVGFIGLYQSLYASSLGHYFSERNLDFRDFNFAPFKIALIASPNLPVTLEEKPARKKGKFHQNTSNRCSKITTQPSAETQIHFSRKQPQKNKLKIGKSKSKTFELSNETQNDMSAENQKIKLKKFTRLNGSKVRFHAILSDGKVVYYPAHKKNRFWKQEREQARLKKQSVLTSSNDDAIEDTLVEPQSSTLFEEPTHSETQDDEESYKSDSALSDSGLADFVEDMDIFDKHALDFYDAYEAKVRKTNRKLFN